MPHFPEHLSKIEAGIINRLITASLKDDLLIRVACPWEGDTFVDFTRDREAIQKETAATGETAYFFEDKNTKVRVGYVLLVHGNGEEVISDTGWPSEYPEYEARIDALCAHANKEKS